MSRPDQLFPPQEYQKRITSIQSEMDRSGIDALLLTTEADVRYVTGFLTRFWESPTRPWYVILPKSGKPVAVIPSIGAALMRQTGLDDIRTWRAPDYSDDGVSLLARTLTEIAGPSACVGTPMGLESHLRMALADWETLKTKRPAMVFRDDAKIMRRARMIKSGLEIGKIRTACAIANRAFARVPEIAAQGVALNQVFRRFQILCLEEGADWVPYLAGGAGQGGYDDVISPATDHPLHSGDVLMLDTGLVHDGYFCDFDRNFSVGPPEPFVKDAHAKLITATRAAADIARPGALAADLFHVMDHHVTGGAGGSDAGRLGHGLGMQLTEGLSLIPQDQTVLEPGMVLTLEPGLTFPNGRIMVHEEVILITEGAAEFLSEPASHDMTVLEGAA